MIYAYCVVGCLLLVVALRNGLMDELDDAFTAAVKSLAFIAFWPVVFGLWTIGRLVIAIADRIEKP